MEKLKTIISSIIIAIFIISVTNAENFDPEVISQLSKNIAERKLMSAGESETQGEQMIYVSSSLRGMVEQGRDEKMGLINGLVAFDDSYLVVPEIGKFELSNALNISNKYINNLPNIDNHHTNPWYDVPSSIGGEITIRGLGDTCGNAGRAYNEMANTYRLLRVDSYNKIADTYIRLGYSPNPAGDVFRLSPSGLYVSNCRTWIDKGNFYRGKALKLGSTDIALRNTARGLRIYETGTTIINSGLQAVDTFAKTIDYVGTSMQTMNPPVYLKNNSEFGQFAKFTPSSQKILGVPTSGTCGTWEGHGSYSISGGSVRYKEILQTSGTGPITRTHTDWVTTNVGNYYRHTEICTPATNNFERFVVSRYPTGSYWDLNTSYSHTVKQSQISYRYENIRGVERITPLPSPGVGRWNYSQTSWSIPQSSWTIPRTNYSFPKTNFSIPKTNYNFNHRY